MECVVQLKQPHFSSEIFYEILLKHSAIFCVPVQEKSVFVKFEPQPFLTVLLTTGSLVRIILMLLRVEEVLNTSH